MVAKLVSVEDFCVRAGLGEVDDLAEEVQNKVRYSIEAATTHLVTYVRSEFDAVTGQVDTYYVDCDEFPFVGEFPRFYLSRGFVSTPVSGLGMITAPLLNELPTGDVVGTAWLVLDQTKGTVLITGTDTVSVGIFPPIAGNRYFVQITYDAGFAETADAFGSIYVDAPSWLTEPAFLVAKAIFDTGVPCDASGNDGAGVPCMLQRLISEHIRFLPSALKPMS